MTGDRFQRLTLLVRKEVHQHRWPLVALSLLLLVGLGLNLWEEESARRSLSLFEAANRFVIIFLPMAALLLGNRLVVNEYQGRTQRFVEALPIHRMEMLMGKFLFGWAYLICASSVALLVVSVMASEIEAPDLHFAWILTVRTQAFVYCLWCFVFAMGFTGKLRIPIYVGIVFTIIILLHFKDLDLQRFGPFALIDPETFSLERNAIPVYQTLQTLAVGSGCLCLALCLASIREGSVAETLAQRMTRREKMTVGAILIVSLFASIVLEERREKEPYRFKSEAVVRVDDPPIDILYGQAGIKPHAQQLLNRLQISLREFYDHIGITERPAVNIAYSASLDGRTYETARLDDVDGVLIRANFYALTANREKALAAYLLRAILVKSTHHRSRFEPKYWLHDGLSRWYFEHGVGEGSATVNEQLLLRALVAVGEDGIQARDLRRWAEIREQIGEPLAEALAYTGLVALEDRKGRAAVLALARGMYGREFTDDVRETFYEWHHPMARLFAQTTGLSWKEFLEHWNTWLRIQRAHHDRQARLATLQGILANVEIRSRDGGLRDIEYRFIFDQGPPESGTVCTLLHRKLSPFSRAIKPHSLLREEQICNPNASTRRLSGRYGPGERVFLGLEVDSILLDTPVRVYAQRRVMP